MYRCAVDPKSLLYLYGLQLDYSDELIGGARALANFSRPKSLSDLYAEYRDLERARNKAAQEQSNQTPPNAENPSEDGPVRDADFEEKKPEGDK